MSQEEMLRLMEEQNRLLHEQNQLKRREMGDYDEDYFKARMQSTFQDLDRQRLGYGDSEKSFDDVAKRLNKELAQVRQSRPYNACFYGVGD